MKNVLVTGSTKGIGLAIARKFCKSGYHAFTNGRGNTSMLSSSNMTYIQADVSTLDGVSILTSSVVKEVNLLDVLILNAGATCRKSLVDIEYKDWQHVMDTNVNMPFFIVQQLKDYISEYGSIIFISSSLSLWPHAISLPYGVSKAAINMMAKSLVKEFAEKKIRVNVICPGFIDTEWQKEKSPSLRAKIEDKIALGRFGTPEEVADMCLSVVQNKYVNGSILSIDGGYDFI